ncbi:alkaline shock response membrane anchor protein AmaP [Corynebacterium sp. CCM 9203]|uniref:alkaline shock response membrane anchor protein AmaP n=1 Tax=Corynebacterium sp. CCM 9203 TaxID=3057615 RepID=UPI0035233D78
MSHGLAFVDRLLVFIIGLLLTLLGAWSIALFFDVEQAERITAYADQEMWRNAADQAWYLWALIVTVAAGIIIGLWLIIVNVRRRSVSVVTSVASTDMGDISFHLGNLADAVAFSIDAAPGVSRVRRRVAVDRGLTTMEFTIDADPDCSVPGIYKAVEQAERDLRDAVRDREIATSYRIHIERVPQNHDV